MNQTTKLPLHYPLTNEEWLSTVQELKPAEIIILYHLRTMTPFGDRPQNIGVRALARTLNLAPSTTSQALKRLDQLGYIDLELLQVKLKVLSKGLLYGQENDVSPEKQEVFAVPNSSVHSTEHPQNSVHVTEQVFTSPNTTVHVTEHLFTSPNTQPLEPSLDKASRLSKTIKTLKKDFKDPLYANAEKNSEQEQEENQGNSQEGSLESVGQIFESIVQQLKQPTDSVKDQNSAPPLKPVENSNPILKLEERLNQGGKLPPWRTGTGPNDLNPEFVEWIRKWMCSIPPVRDRSKGDALSYIRKQEISGATPVLEARAEEWLLATHKAKEAQQQYEATIAAAVAPRTEPPTGNPEASANFRKMLEILRPKKPSPEIIDTSDVQARLSVYRMRLGWDADRSRQWFVEKFGKPCDRLNDSELLEAADQLEKLYECQKTQKESTPC